MKESSHLYPSIVTFILYSPEVNYAVVLRGKVKLSEIVIIEMHTYYVRN